MLIGIDMLGVQSPGAGSREAGRFGRQLAKALVTRDHSHRYLLYTHEGLSTRYVPSVRSANRVTLSPGHCLSNPRRSATRQLLDQNPDGLDWLILLDPFDPGYGGVPPDSPLEGPRIASVIHQCSTPPGNDRANLTLLRHDALLAVTETVASETMKRLGTVDHRISTIGLAIDEEFGPAETMTQVTGEELGRLGIRGPFLMTSSMGDPTGLDVRAVLDGYRTLPISLRESIQLVITGEVTDPVALRSILGEAGAENGLVLVGEVSDSLLATLYGRCTAYLDASTRGGSGLALIEAMTCGAPIIADDSLARQEILGDSGILVSSRDLSSLAGVIERVTQDPDFRVELSRGSLARSTLFSFDPVVESVLDALGEIGPAKSSHRRFDRGHRARPRIALFLDAPTVEESGFDYSAQVPSEWLEAYSIDLYLEPGQNSYIDRLPPTLGGFDARLFARNNAIIRYYGVIHQLGNPQNLDAVLNRLLIRPGLVIMEEGDWLDDVGSGGPEGNSEVGLDGLRAIFETGSLVVLSSPDVCQRVRSTLPEFADRIIELSMDEDPESSPDNSETSRLASIPIELIDRAGDEWRRIGNRRRQVDGYRSCSGSPHSQGVWTTQNGTAPRSR